MYTLLFSLAILQFLLPILQAFVPPSSNRPPENDLPGPTHWSFSSNAPSWCSKMLKMPLKATICHRDRKTMKCSNNNQYMMFSQMGQDYYLFTRHFAHLKRRGVYLDIATNDPVGISNTFFMEQCLGWKGLCVEASPQYLGAIHNVRNCGLVPNCVSDKMGQRVKFGLASGLSGIMETNKNKANWEKSGREITTLTMECSTMEFEMDKYSVKKVDYLSLDVEGHELEVLKGFAWHRVKVNVMTIEAGTEEKAKEIEEFLNGKGYVKHIPTLDERSERTGKLMEDVVFLHKDVAFGKPV